MGLVRPISEMQRLAVTRGEGDNRYTRPPDVTRIIDSYPSTHAPVTLAAGSDPALTLVGQQLDLDLSSVGVTDHGALTGLADDDHTQYHNNARGDARYVQLSTLTTKGDIFARTSSTVTRVAVGSNGQVLTADSAASAGVSWQTPSSGVTDHGALTGLGDDDHTQYHNDARGDARYYKKTDFSSNPTTSSSIPLHTGTGGLLTLEKLYINDNGGNSDFDAGVQLQVINSSIGVSRNDDSATLDAYSYGFFSAFRGRRAGGSPGSPSSLGSDVEVVRFGGAGYSSAFPGGSNAYMSVFTSQSLSSSNKGHRMEFWTTTNGQVNATQKMVLGDAGALFLNDTSNANITVGLTLNQGAADDQIFACKSSDVDHTRTGFAETDTFFYVEKIAAANGGANVVGMADGGDGRGLNLGANVPTADTTSTTAAVGVVNVRAFEGSGTGGAAIGTGDNAFVVQNATAARFIVKGNGDLYVRNATLTVFDDHDDAQLVRALDLAAGAENLERPFDDMLQYNRADIERLGLAAFDKSGDVFINIPKAIKLLFGAIWQLNERINRRIENSGKQLGTGVG